MPNGFGVVSASEKHVREGHRYQISVLKLAPLFRTFRLPLHDDIAEEGRGDGEGDDEREEQKMPHSEHFRGR